MKFAIVGVKYTTRGGRFCLDPFARGPLQW
jgi:hypothetical protein